MAEQLLLNADIDIVRLKSIFNRIEQEGIKLSEPCYFPETREYCLELREACGLNQQNIDDFIERTWGGRKEKKWQATSDEITLFFIWLMWCGLRQNDLAIFRSALISHMIRQYGNLLRKYFIFCDPDVFMDTLDNLTKTHLFCREGTILGALYYLNGEVENKFIEGIGAWDLDKISAFITESRGRLNQSLKGFAKSYYKNKKKREQQNEQEVGASPLDRVEQLTSEVTKWICIEGHIDQQALDYARKISGIRMSTATALVNELSKVHYSGDVRLILELFLKDLPSIGRICEQTGFLIKYTGALMRVKRTIKPVYFKQKVQELLLKIVKQIQYEKTFNSLTNQTRFLHSKFLAYYLTMVSKNLYCAPR